VYPEEIEGPITHRQEAKILAREDIYRRVVEALIRIRKEVREQLLPLAFCSTIRECDKFQEVAQQVGLTCEVVTGRECRKDSGSDLIQQAQRRLLNGEIDLIASVDKLQVGWDFPPLNTILQLRATLSPAILAQEAGRASRNHPDKTNAYIIEPRWRRNRPSFQEVTRKGKKIRREDLHLPHSDEDEEQCEDEDAAPFYWETTIEEKKTGKKHRPKGPTTPGSQNEEDMEIRRLKFHKTPLTLAEAFHILGEQDVDAVCEGWHGERLRYGEVSSLDENGTITIGSEIAVGLGAFADIHQLNKGTLKIAAKENGLEPIGIALQNSQYVPVYRLVEVYALQYVTDRLNFERLSRAGDEVIVEGMACVGLSAFASLHGLDRRSLLKHAEAAGVKPLGQAMSGSDKIDIYPKSRLEALPYVQLQSTLKTIDPTTSQVSINGKKCEGLNSFVTSRGLSSITLEQALHEAKIEPEGQAYQQRRAIDVYDVKQLEQLPYVKDRQSLPRIDAETGEVDIRGTRCISLSAYSRLHLELTRLNLIAACEDKIEPAGYAITSRGRKVMVYPKATIEQLSYVKDRLNESPKMDEKGEIVINDEVCVGLHAFCQQHQGLHYVPLTTALTESGVTSIGTALTTQQKKVDVYRKADLLNLPYVRERLQ